MDLGLSGRKALVCAASKGLGRGRAEALACEGVDVTINTLLPGPFDTDRLHANIEWRGRNSGQASRRHAPGADGCE